MRPRANELLRLRMPMIAMLALGVFPAGCNPQAAGKPPASISFNSRAAWMDGVGRARTDDFPGLWNGALEIEDPSVREEVIAALFSRWIAADTKGLDDVLAAWPRDDARWGRALPAMLKVLPLANDRVGKDPALVHLFSMVSGAYAKRDSDAAATWSRQQLDRSGRDIAMSVIVEEVALKSPAQATQLADVIDDKVIRLDALHGIGSSLGAVKPEEATAWVRTLPAESQPEALRAVLESWAAFNPRAALAYTLREHDSDGQAVVFAKWASDAQGDAAIAARSMADPASREVAIAAVVEKFNRIIPVNVAAGDWARRLPAGAGRDAVSALLAADLAARNPDEAWRVAQAIDDAKARREACRSVVAAVAVDDPDIARKLIDDDGSLSAAESTALRSLIASP